VTAVLTAALNSDISKAQTLKIPVATTEEMSAEMTIALVRRIKPSSYPLPKP
jgi:hypothetical protein